MLADALALTLADDPGIASVEIAADGEAAVRAVAAEQPDVVIMDHHLPGPDGLAVTRAVHRVCPDVPVVMLTGDTSDELLLAAVNAGISGFLIKDQAVERLMDAVRRAADGEMVWPAERMARLLARSRRTATTAKASSDLTPRERDVLRLMSEGLDNKVIAERLRLSLATVRGYVQQVLAKLGAHSKLEAVVIASRTGLLSDLRKTTAK